MANKEALEALEVLEQGVESLALSLCEVLQVIDRVKSTGFVLGDSEQQAVVRARALLDGGDDTGVQPDLFAACQQPENGDSIAVLYKLDNHG